MISAIIAALLLLLAGLPLALALPGGTRRVHAILGEAYLLGVGAAWLVLLALSMMGVGWSRITVLVGLAVVVAIALTRVIPSVERGTWAGGAPLHVPVAPPTQVARSTLGMTAVVDLFTLILIGGHALLATAAPPFENDYLLIWGVKARVFFAAHGIDWHFLQAPLNVTSHPDYPLLVPFVYDVQALVHGAWTDQWLGLTTFLFGLAALLAIRGLLADDLPRLHRAVTTLIVMPVLFSPYIGLAEGPLIAYATVGMLYVRRGVRRQVSATGDSSPEGTAAPTPDTRHPTPASDVLRGAIFLGLAASAKNEGLALIGAVVLAMIAARAVRLLPSLWPAFAIAFPWVAIHRLRGLTVDLAAEGIGSRLAGSLGNAGTVIRVMAAHPVGQPLFWAGAAVACALGLRRIAGRERFLTVAIALQLLVLIGVYFITPRGLTWHVETSWDRVVRQLMPAVAVLAMLAVCDVIASATEKPQCR
jgi:hypothetical protein